MRMICSLMLFVLAGGSGCVLRLPSAGVEGSGRVACQQRDVGDFEGIVMHGSGNLAIQVGEPPAVTVQIDDNLLELIQTEVSEGRLVIKNRDSYRSRQGLRMQITVPKLTYLNIAGAADVQLDDLASEEFQLQLNGSGDLVGQGTATRLSVEINGSGAVDFADMVATDATVSINGSGDVRVQAVEKLSASIRGSGNIRYRGSPAVSRSILGSGDVQPLPEDSPAADTDAQPGDAPVLEDPAFSP